MIVDAWRNVLDALYDIIFDRELVNGTYELCMMQCNSAGGSYAQNLLKDFWKNIHIYGKCAKRLTQYQRLEIA
eukprot:gene15084-17830_t